MAKKKVRKNVIKGVVHINATFNNTIITITDKSGQTLCWDTGGRLATREVERVRHSPLSVRQRQCAQKAKKLGMKEVDIRVKGPGSGRESAIRAIQASGLDIKAIEDTTPLPHNGCRARKRRRV